MRYPMKSAPFKEDGKVIGHGVYDAHGYWFSSPSGPLLYDDPPTAAKVADAVNSAYEAGAESVREKMRDALGL